jgi:hypothetical protein
MRANITTLDAPNVSLGSQHSSPMVAYVLALPAQDGPDLNYRTGVPALTRASTVVWPVAVGTALPVANRWVVYAGAC